MYPIQVGNYDFKRIYLWLQFSDKLPFFTEVVIEVFYPNDRQADGLVMFNHGFLIGTDLMFYPKQLLSKITNQDTPLFEVNPSWYYNYSQAAIDNNWALAFVTTCHQQLDSIPWTDFGGSPRPGQAAYAAASYLIRYGATHKYNDAEAVSKSQFLKPNSRDGLTKNNRVLFAGHSVGGAHAQAAATGFANLQKIGAKGFMPYDPIFFNREVCPDHTPPLSKWNSSLMADPVGVLQLSPVDGANGYLIPLICPGMKPYRETLAETKMPNLMVVGSCDSACLTKSSNPPAWISQADTTSQYAQMTAPGKESWGAICMVEDGGHCGYLRHCNDLCTMADGAQDKLAGCKDVSVYPAGEEEFTFTNELMSRYIQFVAEPGAAGCSFDEWKNGSLMQWLNNPQPGSSGVSLKTFPDGYVHFAG
jgi:hypothetical protein